jgi:hypothetical protein
MSLSRSFRRVARVAVGVGVSALAFAGVMLAPRTAHAQRVYVYSSRPAPPPPAYGYGYGYGYQPAPARPYYYEEPPYALQLGFDVEGVAPINPPQINNQSAVGGGAGFKIRAGEQFRFPGIRFTPEVGYGFDHLWAGDASGNAFSEDMNRFFAGARLGFGRILVPVVYAHLGYGWRQDNAPNGIITTSSSNGGLAFDVGGALDLRVVPHFGIGVHLEYSQITLDQAQPQWLAVGAHADLIF